MTTLTAGIRGLERTVRQARAAALHGQRLTVPQYDALRAIAEGVTESNAAVARHLALTPQTGTTIMQNLERRGFITRAMVPGEGRAMPIQLTKTGKAALKKATRSADLVEEFLVASLTGAEAAQLAELLAKARAAFSAEAPEMTPQLSDEWTTFGEAGDSALTLLTKGAAAFDALAPKTPRLIDNSTTGGSAWTTGEVSADRDSNPS